MEQEMTVISFRIPKRLKRSMRETDTNWSDDVRRFIELRAKRKRKENAIAQIMVALEKMPTVKAGTADKYIREDRDSN